MTKEDYFKYYIQGSDHYLIPKDIFEELFDEMSNWRDESKQLKEVIDKAIEYIKEKARNNCWIDQYESCDLIKILKDIRKKIK